MLRVVQQFNSFHDITTDTEFKLPTTLPLIKVNFIDHLNNALTHLSPWTDLNQDSMSEDKDIEGSQSDDDNIDEVPTRAE